MTRKAQASHKNNLSAPCIEPSSSRKKSGLGEKASMREKKKEKNGNV